MVNTSFEGNILTKKQPDTSTVDLRHISHEDDYEAKNKNLSAAIARAKQLIREFNSHVMKSPMDESASDSLETDGNRKKQTLDTVHTKDFTQLEKGILKISTPIRDNIFDDTISIAGHDVISDKDVMITLSSLINAVEDSQRQIQQLKFKNMLIKSNSNDIQSTFEVEENLRKQQYERMKCQLLLDKQQLLETLQFKEGKIAKYKNRIVEKNRLINKLMRIINENSTGGSLKHHDFPSSKKRSASNSSKSASKDKTNDMLKTLGLLASQVLNDEIDDDSANQTIIQQPSEKKSDTSTSQIDIFNSSNFSIDQGNQSRGITAATSPSDYKSNYETPIEDSTQTDLHTPQVELPKMKSFSTVDGTVKDIS